MLPNIGAITLDTAVEGVRKYNRGFYRRRPNIDLDRSASDMFHDGLGSTLEKIGQQVRFIGNDYGGAAGFRKALSIAPDIANAIFASRENCASAIARARPLIESLPSRESVAFLCKPFIQPCEGKRNWLVWGTKFWHFLNPEAFPIEDSRVDSFFKLAWNQDPVKRYLVMMHAFREFALTHEAWVPALRAADEDFSSVNKLWDKVFFGVREPQAC